MITPTGGQPVLYKDYTGELIDWDDFFKKREEHIELMKNGSSIKACEGCLWIREKDWPERKNEFKYILINIWTKCNLKCIYCDTHSNIDVINNTKEYDIIKVLEDMINKKVITPNTKIDIAGGEAALDKNFNGMIELLLNSGIKKINISTNATIYSDVVAKGINKGVISIITSVDSGSEKMFTYIKKVNLWKKTWQNLKKYTSALNPNGNENTVKTKFIIMPGVNDSKEEILNFILYSKKINASGVLLNIDQKWVCEHSDDCKTNLKIIELTKYFMTISTALNIDWTVWAHLEDFILRHNRNFADKAIDIDLIFNKEVNFTIPNERKEILFANFQKLFLPKV